MTSMLDKLLAADISDPTDFPDNASAPGLRSFDDAVRCNICRDFYDAPVTLTCGHCFCSACVRSALPEHQTCPTCRKPASEVHIRKDVAMETAVQAWQSARPYILRLAREEEARKSRPVRPPHSRHSSDERKANKRRRRDSLAAGSDSDIQIVVPSSPEPSGSSPPATPSGLVSCPSCQRDVPYDTINAHLDSGCKQHLGVPTRTKSGTSANGTRSKQKQQWSTLFGGTSSAPLKRRGKEKELPKSKGKTRATPDNDDEPEHLPKVAYDIHPQKRIADMLAEWDLTTQGDKAALVRRHKRWVVLYNANVDRAPSHRRTLDQLRADLRLEEAEQSAKGRGKETVDDIVAYQKANKAAFAKLTEAARPKKFEHANTDASLSTPTGTGTISQSRAPGHQVSSNKGSRPTSPTGDEVEVVEVDDDS